MRCPRPSHKINLEKKIYILIKHRKFTKLPVIFFVSLSLCTTLWKAYHWFCNDHTSQWIVYTLKQQLTATKTKEKNHSHKKKRKGIKYIILLKIISEKSTIITCWKFVWLGTNSYSFHLPTLKTVRQVWPHATVTTLCIFGFAKHVTSVRRERDRKLFQEHWYIDSTFSEIWLQTFTPNLHSSNTKAPPSMVMVTSRKQHIQLAPCSHMS